MDVAKSSDGTGYHDTPRDGVHQRDVFEGLGNLKRLGVFVLAHSKGWGGATRRPAFSESLRRRLASGVRLAIPEDSRFLSLERDGVRVPRGHASDGW